MGPGQDPYGALRPQMNGPKWAWAQGPNEWAQQGPNESPRMRPNGAGPRAQMNGPNRAVTYVYIYIYIYIYIYLFQQQQLMGNTVVFSPHDADAVGMYDVTRSQPG